MRICIRCKNLNWLTNLMLETVVSKEPFSIARTRSLGVAILNKLVVEFGFSDKLNELLYSAFNSIVNQHGYSSLVDYHPIKYEDGWNQFFTLDAIYVGKWSSAKSPDYIIALKFSKLYCAICAEIGNLCEGLFGKYVIYDNIESKFSIVHMGGVTNVLLDTVGARFIDIENCVIKRFANYAPLRTGRDAVVKDFVRPPMLYSKKPLYYDEKIKHISHYVRIWDFGYGGKHEYQIADYPHWRLI